MSVVQGYIVFEIALLKCVIENVLDKMNCRCPDNGMGLILKK